MKVTDKAIAELLKLSKKGNKTKDSVRITVYRSCCSDTVSFEPSGKKKGDMLVYEGKVKIFTEPFSFPDISAAEVDFDLGGFIVRSENVNCHCMA